jgi:amidase
MIPKPRSINAYCNDELGQLDAVGLAEKISKKEVSPLEVIEASINRALKVEPELNSIAEEMFDVAREYTFSSLTGCFAGVPTVIKENDDFKGIKTAHGSAAINAKPAKSSSEFVKQFLSLGMIPLAKTRMPEFGLTGSTESSYFGPTRNPWNLAHSTGGSSGGSAALVAAGVVPLAHGNDGGGSIRIPAACCGLVGLKPTRSRLIDMHGANMLPVNLGHQGVLSRSVRDTAVFYSEAEKYYRNKKLPALGDITRVGTKRLRIGFFIDGPGHLISDTDNAAAVHQAAKLCSDLGHCVEEVPFPFDPAFGDDFLLYWGMLAYTFSRAGGLVYGAKIDKRKFEPLTLGLRKNFQKNMFKAPMAIKRLRAFGDIYEQELKKYDVMLSPVLGHPPPKIGYLAPDVEFESAIERLKRFVPYCAIQNVSGAPSIALPIGMSQKHVPVGVQFFAPFGEDKRLIELAYEVEEISPFVLNTNE